MAATGSGTDSRANIVLRGPDSASKWLTLIAACLGLGMLMIDTFVVNVAFPAIARSFKAELSTAEWTVSGYVLVLAVLPIAMGRLGDLFGRRAVYIAGLLLFIVSSAASGAAQGIGQLIVFRVLQGVGAATMMPGTLSLITRAFPARQRGLAIGIWGGVSGLGLIAGPILGGLLVHGDSWRWIFFINLPIGAIALAMAVLFVVESRDEYAPRSIDWPGLGSLSGALFLIMYGFTRANGEGWTSPLILSCFAAGLVLLAAFVYVEQRVRYPLVELALFRSGTFVMACLSALLFSLAVFGTQPYTSLFMQNYWGFTPLQGGFGYLPSTALVALMMPASGIIGQRLGSRLRLLVVIGSVLVGLSFLYMLRLDSSSNYAVGFLPPFLIRGAGIGLVMSASSLAVMSAVPLAKSGLASGTLTMARNIGTSMGVALMGAVYLSHVDGAVATRVGSTSPDQLARLKAGVDHFVPAGQGSVNAVMRQIIVEGFVRTAVVASLVCVVATLAAFFIRHSLSVTVPPIPETAPSPIVALTTAST